MNGFSSRINRGIISLIALCLTASPTMAQSASGVVDKILFGSCIKQQNPAPILDTIAESEPDLFLFLGDNIYADTEDMEVMRQKYAKLGAMSGFKRLMKNTPVMATWDDHDFGVNDGGANYPKRTESQVAFLDFWGEPADSPRRSRPGVYDAKVFGPAGKRVQIILLDTRFFRSPLKEGPKRVGGRWVPDNDRTKTMLGQEQWEWLETELQRPAELRILVSSIQCVASDAGQETWSNLPIERQRLFDLIESTRAEGCLLVSGDRHWSELSMTDENTPYPIYDLTSSSLNQIHPRGTPTENRYRFLPNTFHQQNFGVIAIDWETDDPTITLEIRDSANEVQLKHQIKRSQLVQ